MITLTLPNSESYTYPTLRAVAHALESATEYEVYCIQFMQDGKRISWVTVWKEMQKIEPVRIEQALP